MSDNELNLDINYDTIGDIFDFVEDSEKLIQKKYKEQNRRMYHLKALYLTALSMFERKDIKPQNIKQTLVDEYNEQFIALGKQEAEDAYVYNQKEENDISFYKNELNRIWNTYVVPSAKSVFHKAAEDVQTNIKLASQFVKGTWGHLHESYVNAKADGSFKTYSYKGQTYAPVDHFATTPSFADEKVGGPTEVYIDGALHVIDDGKNMYLQNDPDINQAMLDLEKIYKEDGLRFVVLEKGMKAEVARNYMVAAALLKQNGVNVKCIITDKDLREEVLSDEFTAEINEIIAASEKGQEADSVPVQEQLEVGDPAPEQEEDLNEDTETGEKGPIALDPVPVAAQLPEGEQLPADDNADNTNNDEPEDKTEAITPSDVILLPEPSKGKEEGTDIEKLERALRTSKNVAALVGPKYVPENTGKTPEDEPAKEVSADKPVDENTETGAEKVAEDAPKKYDAAKAWERAMFQVSKRWPSSAEDSVMDTKHDDEVTEKVAEDSVIVKANSGAAPKAVITYDMANNGRKSYAMGAVNRKAKTDLKIAVEQHHCENPRDDIFGINNADNLSLVYFSGVLEEAKAIDTGTFTADELFATAKKAADVKTDAHITFKINTDLQKYVSSLACIKGNQNTL